MREQKNSRLSKIFVEKRAYQDMIQACEAKKDAPIGPDAA